MWSLPEIIARNQSLAKGAKRGWCKCPPKPGELDQHRISAILDSLMVCLKCGKRVKPKRK